MYKKPVLVAIFAHPDDEAFGPGGTLALYSQTHDVYVVCATRGEKGHNGHPDGHKTIAQQREQELLSSAQVLGVKKVIFLDYIDGTLCNNIYHDIAKNVLAVVRPLEPDILLTFEMQGVSGHIDHVVMSMVTNYIFDDLPSAKTLMMYCNSCDYRAEIKNYFVFCPTGYEPEEIDETIDVNSVWATKVKAMEQHATQKTDMLNILARYEHLPKEEYFLIREK